MDPLSWARHRLEMPKKGLCSRCSYRLLRLRYARIVALTNEQ